MVAGLESSQRRQPLQADGTLPGVPASWSLEATRQEVQEVSRRLLQLHSLLGGPQISDSSQPSGAAYVCRTRCRGPCCMCHVGLHVAVVCVQA